MTVNIGSSGVKWAGWGKSLVLMLVNTQRPRINKSIFTISRRALQAILAKGKP